MILYDNYPNIFALKSKMRYLIMGFISAIFLASCATDDTTIYEVGSDFIENNIQIKVVDTFSVKAGSFKVDSLITSATGRILVGNIVDENLGHLSAKSYLQLITTDYSLSAEAVYDSIGFVLNYDTYYYGDTTKVQTYKLHRITETFLPDEGTNFYNTSSLKYDNASIGALSFIPKPTKESDSLFIKMDDVLGKEIFDKISDNDINTSDDFLQYFKGLAIIPDSSVNSHVLGFNVSATSAASGNSSMRLYYTIKDGDSDDTSYYLDFVIASASQQFNQIETNLSNTVLGDFEDGEEIKISSETNNLIFAQSGSGIAARIEIPSIKSIFEQAANTTTLSATLTFYPLVGSYNANNPLPTNLAVYIVDHKNRIIKQLTDADGNVASAILKTDDDEFNANTYYTLDLSGFVEEISLADTTLNYALMIQAVNEKNNVNNLMIENNLSTNTKIKLSVKNVNY